MKRDCTIHVVKTKALISCAVTAQLICIFVFAYANCWFSHAQAQIIMNHVSKRFFSTLGKVSTATKSIKHHNYIVHRTQALITFNINGKIHGHYMRQLLFKAHF